MDISNAKTRDK